MQHTTSDDEDRDEGPTDDDVARFSAPQFRSCPDCGCRVIDDADMCPKCHAYLWESGEGMQPRQLSPLTRVFIILAIILILTFSGLLAFLFR